MQREKFQNAEQMWFWFMYSKRARRGAIRTPGLSSRPCELIDIETLITKLYLSGRLTDEQLAVMAKYGERYRTPNPNIFPEANDARLWADAMQTITTATVRVGWVEPHGGAL